MRLLWRRWRCHRAHRRLTAAMLKAWDEETARRVNELTAAGTVAGSLAYIA